MQVWVTGSLRRPLAIARQNSRPRPGSGRAATSRTAKTGSGRRPGARNRSLTGSRSISPRTTRCASRTKRSTKPSTSRAAERSNSSWSPACAPGGTARPARPHPAQNLGPRLTRGNDQRTSGRGRGSCRPWALAGRLDNRSQPVGIGTLVERTTRFTMLLYLPREEGYGTIPRTKNGPALAGYGALSMNKALTPVITTLPEQLQRSLTWDRGKEFSQHAQFRLDAGVAVELRRPAQPLAARDEREHERPSPPVLSQGLRSVQMVARRTPGRGSRPQHPHPQDTWMEDPSRDTRRTPTLDSTSRCCDDRWIPPCLLLCHFLSCPLSGLAWRHVRSGSRGGGAARRGLHAAR